MQGGLHQQRDFLVAQPIRPRRLQARPRPIADALQFSPFHRQNDFGGAGIAVDDLELRAEQRVQEPRRRLRIDAGGAADDQLLLEKVVGRLVRRGVPRRRHGHFAVDASDPVETDEIEADRLRVPVLYQQHAPHHESDDGAVLGSGIVDVIGRRETAGSRHVLHDDGRIARDMLAKVARYQTRLPAVAAARAGADDERDLPAGVEFGNRLRRGASRGEQHRSREEKRDAVHRASQSIPARTVPRVVGSPLIKAAFLRVSLKLVGRKPSAIQKDAHPIPSTKSGTPTAITTAMARCSHRPCAETWNFQYIPPALSMTPQITYATLRTIQIRKNPRRAFITPSPNFPKPPAHPRYHQLP